MMTAAAAIPSEWDRAVAYGDGLFETIAVFDGLAPLWPLHRQRLVRSLQRLAIESDINLIEQAFLAVCAENSNVLVKIVVARSGGRRGYSSQQCGSCAFRIHTYPLPVYPVDRRQQGAQLHLCRHRLGDNPALAGIKHLNRLEQVLAASEWDRQIADEGLMLDSSGSVIEGTVSNVFVWSGGVLKTPILDRCGVAGVMRSYMLEQLAPSLSLPIQEQRLTVNELLSADGVFVCNSVFGLWPARSLGVSQLAQSPDLVGRIWQLLSALGYERMYG